MQCRSFCFDLQPQQTDSLSTESHSAESTATD